MTRQSPTMRNLAKELEAYNALREALAQMTDDDVAIADTLEGGTNFEEAVEAVVMAMDNDQILLDGIAARLEELTARQGRIERRKAWKRAALEQALTITEVKMIERPTFTITLKRKPEGLVITDEASIPVIYWKPKDPTLDKAALKKALNDGEKVEGAGLDNGGVSVQLRRK